MISILPHDRRKPAKLDESQHRKNIKEHLLKAFTTVVSDFMKSDQAVGIEVPAAEDLAEQVEFEMFK